MGGAASGFVPSASWFGSDSVLREMRGDPHKVTDDDYGNKYLRKDICLKLSHRMLCSAVSTATERALQRLLRLFQSL